MERCSGIRSSVLASNLLRHTFDSGLQLWSESSGDAMGESFFRHLLERDGFWACTCSVDHGSPEWLVSKEGDDYSWLAHCDPNCRRTGSTVVNYCGNIVEEPVMRHITEQKNTFWNIGCP